MAASGKQKKVRFAVVGLGHIAQAAILPAFRQVENAELAALVSSDADKLSALGEKYEVKRTCSYEQFDDCMRSGDIDAVFIALPNDKHRDYTVRAAHAGVHVLCEKPLAVTTEDCDAMIQACADNNVKLMTAYRLHFEAGNLEAIDIAQSGRLGNLRAFQSTFGMQVRPGNVRTKAAQGGGSVYDIGVYCINAARYIFQDEPTEVIAASTSGTDERFAEIDEMSSVILRFPQGRIASFWCSFNSPSIAQYTVLGDKGILRVEPAYEYAADIKHKLTIDGKSEEKVFPKRDQFGAEIAYFADCVLNDVDPEPDGWEGLADVKIVEAIYRSAQCGMPVKLTPFHRDKKRASKAQEIARPPIEEPELVGVEAPNQD